MTVVATMVLPENIFSTSAIAAVLALVDSVTVTLGVVQFSVVVTLKLVQVGKPVQA
jgi:hypothetical protein